MRSEKDSMGEVEVPKDAYYGAQSQRAADNFQISPWRLPRRFWEAMGHIKWAAALVNEELGLLPNSLANPIAEAALEVAAGKHDDQFIIDVFQTGSGTSSNMNVNEVIANRAIELLGGQLGSKDPVHPNDHVNLCQSSNDVIPTATHLAALAAITQELEPALEQLGAELRAKAKAFDEVLKSGRTHLMDATPVRLGQEFGGYAQQVLNGLQRIRETKNRLGDLALGGTAVGTGINSHPNFPRATIEKVAAKTSLDLREASDHFEAQGARDAVVECSGALKTVAVSLAKIAGDLRLMASGPRTGLAEIKLPELQPGSSIMPGKVNPVICEAVIQVAAQVIGNDAAITLGGLGSRFELNTMMPLMAYDIIFSIESLAGAALSLAEKCVSGIEADSERSAALLEQSLVVVTALVPSIGYDTAAEVSKEAHKSGKSIREVVLEKGLMTESDLDKALRFREMTDPGLG